MKTTITQARARPGQLWGRIGRTKKPVIRSRKGHEDMKHLSAAELERLQREAIAPLLALLYTDIGEHRERLLRSPGEQIARMRQLASGVAIDHDAATSGVVAKLDEQVARMRDSAVLAKTRNSFMATLEKGTSTSNPSHTRSQKRTSGEERLSQHTL